jgi:hypothetical protein
MDYMEDHKVSRISMVKLRAIIFSSPFEGGVAGAL